MEEFTRNIGRHCTGCYAKEREQQSGETSYATTKMVKIFCSDCNNFFVLIVLPRSIMLWNKGFKRKY
jgi:hypothetical protein